MNEFNNDLCTQNLFHYFIKKVKPSFIFDIGSRDGNEAGIFRNLCKNSSIVAFEADPELCKSIKLRHPSIQVENLAVSDKKSTAKFYITDDVNSCGSLLKNRETEHKREFEVGTIRLDEYIKNVSNAETGALWIDTEGCSFEVLDGARSMIDRIAFIHAEVETIPLWSGQRTLSEVDSLMSEYGFKRVLLNLTEEVSQGNAVYVNEKFKMNRAFYFWEKATRLKNFMVQKVSKFPILYKFLKFLYR